MERPGYLRPPLSPWRLEVEPATRQARDCFLHVLFVGDDAGAETGARAERIEAGGRIGARIPLGGRMATVMFDQAGPCGGTLTITQNGKTVWEGKLPERLP